MNAPLPLPLADPPAPSLPSPPGTLAGAAHAAVAGRFGALLDLARLTLEPAAVAIDASAPGQQEPAEESGDAPHADALDSLLFLANVAVAAPPTESATGVAPMPDALHDVAPAQTAAGTPALNLMIPGATGAGEAATPAISATAAASRPISIAVASSAPADAGTSVAAKHDDRQPVSSDIGAALPRGIELGADAERKAGAKEISNEATRNASIAGAPPPEMPPALAHAAPHHAAATHTSLQATPVVTIAAPLQQPQRFHEEAAASLATLVTRGVERAELRVTPPDLGPVEVRIDVSNGEATLAIVATQPATRDALEQALPLLRDLLAAQGLTLGESSVRDERADTGSRPGDGSSTPRDHEASDATAVSVGVGYRPQRLVDVFA
jgi:flagellar hook-length control protein FliK